MTITLPTTDERRKVLLHLKCLVWCLHQMQTRYNLNLALYSLEHRELHSEIADSNLGDNLAFLMEHLDEDDLGRLRGALESLPRSAGAEDVDDKHFEMGHYIQALRDFGPITEGTYGIICGLTPRLHGLFYLEGGHLIEATFAPPDVRTIFGTYIV